MPVVIVVDAVIHEIHQIRHNSFRSFALQKLNKIVVGQGHVFDQDLPHNTDAWFPPGFVNGQTVKISYYSSAYLCIRRCAGEDLADAACFPFFVERVCRPARLLIGPDTVETAQE